MEFEKFWVTEDMPDAPIETKYTPEARFCVKHYEDTTTFDEDGRARCSLPFKEGAPKLGNSRAQAIRRFLSLEARLKTESKFAAKYQDFMQKFMDLGHLVLVPESEEELPDEQCFYLPHHGVLKESSTTTKLRVVFDASAKTTSGVSLNSILGIGPRVQSVIFDILVRFRFHAIGMAADVGKMYRQIGLDNPAQDFHRLIYRKSPDEPLLTFCMTRVTCGVTSSSFHAIRTLQDCAEFCTTPDAARAIKEDFYVDDLLGGANSVEDALAMRADMVQALEKRQMPIRKWCSNSQEVLDKIPDDDRETATVVVAPDEHGVNTLGVGWNMNEDTFVFLIPDALKEHPVLKSGASTMTRRKLLSAIATVFDPVGWLSPLTVRMKILFQKSWDTTSSWNDKLTAEACVQFHDWVMDLLQTEFLTIPRRVVLTGFDVNPNYEFHVFSDASEQAMAACVYVVCENDGVKSNRLLCAKTKQAPRKFLSIPRLELGGMVLAVRLIQACRRALRNHNYQCVSVTCYTDSTVALYWVKSDPSKWGTFVANRVVAVQDTLPGDTWYHVAGTDNPADLATRDNKPELQELHAWWNGPAFLVGDGEFPVQPENLPEDVVPERKKTVPVVTVSVEAKKPLRPTGSVSCFGKLLRTTVYVLRACVKFLKKIKCEPNFFQQPNPTYDLVHREALLFVVKQEQTEFFAVELEALRAGRTVGISSPTKRLHPFIHADGTVRVGGRLQWAAIDEDEKHPILLPKESRLTKLILKHIHLKMYHAGKGPVLVEFRKIFWVTGAKTRARMTIHDCLKCARHNTRPQAPVMADLPPPRVTPSAPFTHRHRLRWATTCQAQKLR